jgi:long-subunit fatty acid transport protein
VSLGYAYTALADDPLALFWNPAGIVHVERFGLAGAITQWPADIYISSAAVVYNLGKWGTIGASASLMTTGLMNITTVYNPNGNEGTFEVGSWTAGLTYARSLTDRFAVGVTFKLVNENLGNFESMGLGNFNETIWAVDLGSTYNTGFKNLRIGMSVMNFGPEGYYQVDDDFDGQFDEDIRDGLDNDGDNLLDEDTEEAGVPLPLIFRVGFAMDAYESDYMKVTAVGEMYHPPDNVENYNLGAEFWLFDLVAIRGGYSFQRDEGGLTAGVGAKIDMFGLGKVAVDYAYADLGVLSDMVHRMSFNITF